MTQLNKAQGTMHRCKTCGNTGDFYAEVVDKNLCYAKGDGTIVETIELLENVSVKVVQCVECKGKDIVDNNLGYSPENCRWATRKEQCRNVRSNRILTVSGKPVVLAALAEKLGVTGSCIRDRIIRGWSVQRAATELSARKIVRIIYKGVTRTLVDWAKLYGIPTPTLRSRFCKYGWSADRALTTTVKGYTHANKGDSTN